MERKVFVDSPNFKNLKRSIFDCRVDSLLPNTLYLLNLRCNYSKKRISNLNEYNYDDDNETNLVDHDLDRNNLDKKESTYNGTDNGSNLDTTNLDLNNTHTSDTSNDENNKVNNVNYIKSHICFFGMEYYCLKYDLSSTNGVPFTKQSPEHKSYIVSNIFLRKDPELQLDQDALFDASWEVESVHLCKRILSFIKYNLTDKENKPTTNHNPEHTDPNTTTSTGTGTIGDREKEGVCNSSSTNETSTTNGTNYAQQHLEMLNTLNRLEDIRVLDGFCGIGGNTIHFASNFKYTLGVELNPERVEMCKNNLKVYGVTDNCDVLNDNILTFFEEYLKDPEHYFKNVLKRPELYREGEVKQFDWVFLSFPWGGSNYKGARDAEIYNLTDYFTELYRCAKYASMVGHNVTMYLPRSQSLLEIVKSAFLTDFKYILVDCYLIYPSYDKIRCCMVHFLNRSNTFNNNININNVVKINNSKMFFDKLKLVSVTTSSATGDSTTASNEDNKDNDNNSSNRDRNSSSTSTSTSTTNGTNYAQQHLDTLNVVNINYYIDKFNYLNFANIGFLMLLNEHNPNVYKKISALLSLLPLNDVIQLANNAIELYYSSNRPTTITGDERTLGGTFFYLLKMNYNNLYKIIEKKHKIVK